MKLFTAIAYCYLWAVSFAAERKPNIVFVLTDDQDVHMQSVDYMPLLQKYIINEGTYYNHHYCTVSICCPSRVNLWTGLAAHNNNVTDLNPPFVALYGGYPKFVLEGHNNGWLPTYLQEQGYNTYYTGKLFNAHTVDNYDDPPVNGFNGSDIQLDPYTYEYLNTRMTRNGAPPVSYEGRYSPDVVAEKALGFLHEASLHDKPFFLGIAPIAPHSNVRFRDPIEFGMAAYAERHAHLFKDYKIPRTANFNPDIPSGVSWVKDLPKLNDTVIDYHDEFQRSRLRSLQAVDEMIEELIKTLEYKGLLENTYFFYTTDNGYHISQHRLPPGKECPFETDIHIPLAVRGPGIPAGHLSEAITSHTDLTPTLLKIAGHDRWASLDGSPIPLTRAELVQERHAMVNVEFWGRAIPEGRYGWIGNDTFPAVGNGTGRIAARNNTYKALRLVGEQYNLLYTVWCTGERELYDVTRDPDQVKNLFHPREQKLQSEYSLFGRSFEQVINRLDALLMVTKSCKGRECYEPWQTLHPQSSIKTLTHALRPRFDKFYAEQPRVSFSSCVLGHVISEEGPQDVNVWDESFAAGYPGTARQQSFQWSGHWSWWT